MLWEVHIVTSHRGYTDIELKVNIYTGIAEASAKLASPGL